MHFIKRYSSHLTVLLLLLLGCSSVCAQNASWMQLSKFPEDLSTPLLLEYKGLFEDGWVTENSYLIVQQPEAAMLLVRGVVPLIENPKFTTNLQILVNDRVVIEKNLFVGEFTLQTNLLNTTTKKKVELRFSNSQQLPEPDGRGAAALIKFIGFIQVSNKQSETASSNGTRKGLSTPLINDIFIGKGEIALAPGEGWYPLEKQKNKSFRWVNNDAKLIVISPTGEPRPSLDIEVEPGPGVGLKPFELQIIRENKNAVVDRVIVHGHETVRVKLSVEPEIAETFRFHIEGGGKGIPNDTRILNFRIFCVTAVPQKETPSAYAIPAQPAIVATYAKKRNGMFEDGWIGKVTEFLLPQLQAPAILSIRGKIIEAENFTNEVHVLVAGKEVARKELKTGEFNLAIPFADGGGVRKVKLIFAKESNLPNNDQRSVSALLTFIGFETAPQSVPKQ